MIKYFDHQADWQPIETAPTDGTEFLAALSNGWVVKLYAGIAVREGSRYAWWGSGERVSVPYAPSHPADTDWRKTYTMTATHWMPVPKPPFQSDWG